MKSESFKNLITIQEACEYSNFSERHLRLLLEKGKIQGKKIGRDWITTREEIDKYLSTNPKPGRKPKIN
jgi:excisionase family DNA binding protein